MRDGGFRVGGYEYSAVAEATGYKVNDCSTGHLDGVHAEERKQTKLEKTKREGLRSLQLYPTAQFCYSFVPVRNFRRVVTMVQL